MSNVGDRVVDLQLQNPSWDYQRIAAEAGCSPGHSYHLLTLHRAGIRHARSAAAPAPGQIGPLVVRLHEENPSWSHGRIAEEAWSLVPSAKTTAESVSTALSTHRRREREAQALASAPRARATH
jgi:hypothetical protein